MRTEELTDELYKLLQRVAGHELDSELMGQGCESIDPLVDVIIYAARQRCALEKQIREQRHARA